MDISIPAYQWNWGVWTAASYLDTIDWAYNVYSARLMQFNIPNARNDWVHDSQARWWLCSVPNRYNQNANWDAQIASATTSWSTNLDLYSITNEFDVNIELMEAIQWKGAIYTQYYPQVTFNETSDKLATSKNSVVSSTISTVQNKKTYIWVSGGNYFCYVASGATVKSYPCDVNGIITSTTPGDTETMSLASTVWVAAAYNQYLWLCGTYYDGVNTISIKWALYSINSSGVITQISTNVTIRTTTPWVGLTQVSSYFGSYVKNTTAYCFAINAWLNWWTLYDTQSYFTINLWTVSGFTHTEVRGQNDTTTWSPYSMGMSNAYIPVWYDWTQLLADLNGTIYQLTWASFTSSGTSAIVTQANWMRYTNSISKQSTATLNIHSSSTSLFINNSQVNWSLAASTRIMAIYKVTGTNEDDDAAAFLNLYSETPGALSEALYVQLKINTVTYSTFDNSIDGIMSLSSATDQTIGAQSITQNMHLVNTNSQQVKMWFGLTGGTYAAPTGTNGHGWSISTWSTVSANGSYMDIVLA